MAGMNPHEVLAVCRLRQWAADRTAMRNGTITHYKRQGWRERRSSEVDARIVRVIDFERALSQLSDEHQTILLLAYREGQSYRTIASVSGVCERALAYKLPLARQALATILDRNDLL